jgi:MFS transporter, DHA1 family, tetracycline resistance protein
MSLAGGRRQAAVVFIAITVVIDVLGFGVIIPVLPRLVQQFMGGDPARGAAMYGLFGTVWALMQFFFGSITSIAGLIGPTMFTQSFAYFIDPHRMWTVPGMPFYLAAALLIPALLLALLLPMRAAVGVEPAV